MTLLRLIADILAALLSASLFLGFLMSRHISVLLAALVAGASAVASCQWGAWWPLLAGFARGWVLRVLGFDPSRWGAT